MNFSKKQQRDLESILYFMPMQLKGVDITDQDIEDFFAFSDRGVRQRIKTRGYEVLCAGKEWRGIHIHEMWEEGIMDGSVPYFVLLGGETYQELMPRVVVDFLKGEIFKGQDAKMIEGTYQEILRQYRWRIKWDKSMVWLRSLLPWKKK